VRFRHILWNLLGLGLPLVIAALAVPGLLTLIGKERFGYLALAWGLIGYAGALDLGIGRATTQRISALRDSEDNHQIPDVLETAVRITLVSGGIGMLLLMLAALTGVYRFIHSTGVPDIEIQYSMMLLALALPIQAISATFRGVNEAYLNFKKISLLRILLGAANFGAPYLVALYTDKLHWLVATLVLSRCLAFLLYRRFAYDCLIKHGHPLRGRYDRQISRNLMHFGGWLTISFIISPFLVQADRFFVGSLISAVAVTLYVIPFEVTAQSLLFVGAVTTVAFPVISSLIQSAPQEAALLFKRWLFRVTTIMLVSMAALAYMMPALLHVWVGSHVTETSVQVGQILCVGVFFNAIGIMYCSLLHALGKTRVTAIVHIVELPLFIITLYVLIHEYGVIGAAVAWSLRMVFDTTALLMLCRRINPFTAQSAV